MSTRVLAAILCSSVIVSLSACIEYVPCPENQKSCSNVCVDLTTDEKNCGDCGRICDNGSSCVNGECIGQTPQNPEPQQCEPEKGETECNGQCVDILSDPRNCGICGRNCGDELFCEFGNCVAHPAECGCPDGYFCTSLGECRPEDMDCSDGWIACDGYCIDPNTDTLHCGAKDDCKGSNAGERCRDGDSCYGGMCYYPGKNCTFQFLPGEPKNEPFEKLMKQIYYIPVNERVSFELPCYDANLERQDSTKGLLILMSVDNPDCVELENTTGDDGVIRFTLISHSEECEANFELNTGNDIVQTPVRVVKDESPRNYMSDHYDIQFQPESDCRYDDDCGNNGFCDSFLGYKCSTRCTSDKECISSDYYCRADGRCASKAFVTEWEITNEKKTVILPLGSASVCHARIDWGDGQFNEINCEYGSCADVSHSYADIGLYDVSFTALNAYEMLPWNSEYEGEKTLIGWISTEKQSNLFLIKAWGPFGMDLQREDGPVASKFCTQSYCPVLTAAEDVPDADRWTTGKEMFYGTTAFNQDIGNWDTRRVNDMSLMFCGTRDARSGFDQPIGKWNTSLVESMSGMFAWSSFNQDISGWNTSNVTNMSQMFSQDQVFAGELKNWNTSKVINMYQMFSDNFGFNSDIGDWDVSNVQNMSQMFNAARSFNRNLSRWNTVNVKDMTQMFNGARSFNQNVSMWQMHAQLECGAMFKDAGLDKKNKNAMRESGWEKCMYDVGSACSSSNFTPACINSGANALVCSSGAVIEWACANDSCDYDESSNKVYCPK